VQQTRLVVMADTITVKLFKTGPDIFVPVDLLLTVMGAMIFFSLCRIKELN
jgi:hypothetical protein